MQFRLVGHFKLCLEQPFLAGLKFLEPNDWSQLCLDWLPIETKLDFEPVPLAHKFPWFERSVWPQPCLKSARSLTMVRIRLQQSLLDFKFNLKLQLLVFRNISPVLKVHLEYCCPINTKGIQMLSPEQECQLIVKVSSGYQRCVSKKPLQIVILTTVFVLLQIPPLLQEVF